MPLSLCEYNTFVFASKAKQSYFHLVFAKSRSCEEHSDVAGSEAISTVILGSSFAILTFPSVILGEAGNPHYTFTSILSLRAYSLCLCERSEAISPVFAKSRSCEEQSDVAGSKAIPINEGESGVRIHYHARFVFLFVSSYDLYLIRFPEKNLCSL
jgi:hypothetical protein